MRCDHDTAPDAAAAPLRVLVTMTHSDHGHTCDWQFTSAEAAREHVLTYQDAGWFVRRRVVTGAPARDTRTGN